MPGQPRQNLILFSFVSLSASDRGAERDRRRGQRPGGQGLGRIQRSLLYAGDQAGRARVVRVRADGRAPGARQDGQQFAASVTQGNIIFGEDEVKNIK